MRSLFTFVLTAFSLTFFHPVQAQLEYALAPERKEILERDFERLCQLDFDAEFEFGDKEKWESVLKRAFGVEEIDCLAFKKFIEDRVGLIVDHFSIDNLATVHLDGTVKRREDWNVVFADGVGALVELFDFLVEEEGHAARLEKALHSGFHILIGEALSVRNYIFVLEYTTNAGEKKMLPIFSKASVPGVVLLTDKVFNDWYNSFERMAILIHEARHEREEFKHVHCLSDSKMGCDNASDGPYGLQALFSAYIAGICGDNCSEREKDNLIDFALGKFDKINLYQSDSHKIHPLLEGDLKDRQLALDIHDVMTSLENINRERLQEEIDRALRTLGERRKERERQQESEEEFETDPDLSP